MLIAFEFLAALAALVAMVGLGERAEGPFDWWLTPAAIGVILATWAWHRWRAYQWSRQWRRTIGDLPTGPGALDALESGPLLEAATAFRRSLITASGTAFRHGTSADFIFPGADADRKLDAPPAWLANGHALLLSLGLLGTFVGLTIGLSGVDLKSDQDPKALVEQIGVLFSGAKLAFAKSVAGIAFSIIWSYRWRVVEQEYEGYFERVVRTLDRAFPLLTPTHAVALALESLADRTERAVDTASERAEAPLRDAVAQQRATEVAVLTGADRLAQLLAEAIDRQARDSAEERAELRQLGESLINGFSPKLREALERTLVPILTQVRDQGQTFGAAAAKEMSDVMRAAQGEHLKELGASFEKTTLALDRTQNVVVGNTDLLAQMLGGLQQQLDGLRGATQGLSTTLAASVTPLERIRDDLDAARVALAATTKGLEAERTSLVAASEALRAGEQVVSGRYDSIAQALGALLIQVDATGNACRSLLEVTERGTAASRENVRTVGDAVTELQRAAAITRAQMDELVRTATTTSETTGGKITDAADHFDRSMQSVAAQLAQWLASQNQATTQSTADAIQLVTAAIRDAGEGFRQQVSAMGAAVGPVREDLQKAAAALQQSAAATSTGARGLAEAGEQLRTSLGAATQPLERFRTGMDEVSKSLDLAARSIESERTALQGLGGQLQTQSQALSTQITQFRGLLSGEVAANLQGVRASNDAIAASWARVNQQTLQNLDLFAQRTKDYADHIGNTITLPQDVQNLDGTLADLRDTLRHLKGVLEAHERVADGPTA